MLFFIVVPFIITVTWYLRPLCRSTLGVAIRNRRVPRCFGQPLSSIIGTHESSHDLRCGRCPLPRLQHLGVLSGLGGLGTRRCVQEHGSIRGCTSRFCSSRSLVLLVYEIFVIKVGGTGCAAVDAAHRLSLFDGALNIVPFQMYLVVVFLADSAIWPMSGLTVVLPEGSMLECLVALCAILFTGYSVVTLISKFYPNYFT